MVYKTVLGGIETGPLRREVWIRKITGQLEW